MRNSWQYWQRLWTSTSQILDLQTLRSMGAENIKNKYLATNLWSMSKSSQFKQASCGQTDHCSAQYVGKPQAPLAAGHIEPRSIDTTWRES